MVFPAWEAFLEACRSGSITTAAMNLGYSQSATSRQIAALERLVGLRLLDRGADGVRPTPAGEAFARHARLAVNEAGRAIRAAQQASADQVHLAVGATPSAAASIVPAALRDLAAATPVRWTLVTDLTARLEELVAGGELDVAITTDAPPGLTPRPDVERLLIGYDEMFVIASPGSVPAGRGRRPLAAFADQVWVEDNPGSAALLRQAAARAGFEPAVDLAAADLLGKMALVAAGHGVALVPGLLRPAIRPDVRQLRLQDPPSRSIQLTTAAPAAPIVRAFHTALIAVARAAGVAGTGGSASR